MFADDKRRYGGKSNNKKNQRNRRVKLSLSETSVNNRKNFDLWMRFGIQISLIFIIFAIVCQQSMFKKGNMERIQPIRICELVS